MSEINTKSEAGKSCTIFIKVYDHNFEFLGIKHDYHSF